MSQPEVNKMEAAETFADALLRHCEQRFKSANYTPRNRFEIYTLGFAAANLRENATYEELEKYIAKMHGRFLKASGGDEREMMRKIEAVLSLPADHITGERPRDARLYKVQRIPGTKYSLRLFPGSSIAREWCLEFINTRNQKAILTPPGTTVWHCPDPDWAEGVGYNRVFSLETTFGPSLPGLTITAEKYILRDGEKCYIHMPAQGQIKTKSVEFTVPRRPPHTPPSLPDGHHYQLAFT